MVEIDGRNHRHVRRHRVGCIEPAAQTGFKYNNVELLFAEVPESKRGGHFEKCRVRLPGRYQLTNVGQTTRRILLRYELSAYLNPFAKRDQVRRCEESRSQALRPANCIRHSAYRTFSICPR